MLSALYRSPLNFSEELMEAAKNGLERILTAADHLTFLRKNVKSENETEAEKESLAETELYVKRFEEAMEDDCNTADAVSAVFELVKYLNQNASSENSGEYLDALRSRLATLMNVLGISVETEEEILGSEIEKLIEERKNARKEKNFARADEIREELLKKGIVLEDTREGVKWKRV